MTFHHAKCKIQGFHNKQPHQCPMQPTLVTFPFTPPQLQEVLLIPQSTHVLWGRIFAFESPPVWKMSFLHVSRLTSVLFLFSKLSTRKGFSEHYLACCIILLFSLSPFTCLFFFLELDAGNRQLLGFINSEILSVETRAVILHNLRVTKLCQIKLLSLITQLLFYFH